ncbi:MAG: SurA N-terminal domain-containing protein [bacterium]
MKKILIIVVVLLIAVTGLFAKQEDKILVKVNDGLILASEIDEAVEMASTQSKIAGKPFNEESFKKIILKNLVEQKLIITMAKSENIVVSEEAVADKVNEFLDGMRARFQSEEAFEAALEKEGLSYTDFRIKIEAQVRDNLVYSKVKQKKQQEFISKTSVSDKEIQNYFDKNKDAFKVNDQMNLSQIYFTKGLVDTNDLKKYVADIAARIKTESFEKISTELTGKKGIAVAELGWVDTAAMDQRIRTALKNPKKGKVVEPIESPATEQGDAGGFQIIKIVDYKGGKTPILSDIKEKVRVKIIESKVDKLWMDWIENAKAEAYIKYM